MSREARSGLRVRPEQPGDRAAVRAVNEAAFEASTEAEIIDALRADDAMLVSLVAELDGGIVGHIVFSPITLEGPTPGGSIAALGPMAVLPERQRKGVGGALIRAGLAACRELGVAVVVVLGHPEYYPRFGFVPAASHGLHSEYPVPPEVFMVCELQEGALRGAGGLVRYHRAFAEGEP